MFGFAAATFLNFWFLLVIDWSSLYLTRASTDTDMVDMQTYANWAQQWYGSPDSAQTERSYRIQNNSVVNITAQAGSTAFLHCQVPATINRMAGTEHVSWIRRRDWHILSSGTSTYTNDERFQILHLEGTNDWTLQVKYVQKRDNGTYECQVSGTSTGLLSQFISLQIVVPVARIKGISSGEYHVDKGSTIDLTCVIEMSPTPPQYVFWYRNDVMINYDSYRGGIKVETTPDFPTQSRLTIANSNEADSGNYTCSAANTGSTSVFVYVSQGDTVDAILMRSSCKQCMADQFLVLLIAAMSICMCRGYF